MEATTTRPTVRVEYIPAGGLPDPTDQRLLAAVGKGLQDGAWLCKIGLRPEDNEAGSVVICDLYVPDPEGIGKATKLLAEGLCAFLSWPEAAVHSYRRLDVRTPMYSLEELFGELLRAEGKWSGAKLDVRLDAKWDHENKQHTGRVRVTSPDGPVNQEEIEMVTTILDDEAAKAPFYMEVVNNGLEVTLI